MDEDAKPMIENDLPTADNETVKRMGDMALKNHFEQVKREKIAQLVPTKSDKELAEELKIKVAEAYKPFLELLNEYDQYGLNVQAGVGKNAFGKYQIVQLQVIKLF